ncbi:protein 5NUC-like isoform X2 [Lycorma delicatula]|uniref:protein 5NUC-like isoform X2 n=1 Tax=Lycorma delicatula TaxID=130591 RepID=UPI003F514520
MLFKKLLVNLLGIYIILLKYNYVSAEFKLTVLHTNDMHARFEETNELSNKCADVDKKLGKCFGGFARLRQAVKMYTEDAESRGRHVLFLNAGDSFQGTPYYNLFKWKIVAKMTDILGLNAASLGNHEFDDGPQGLAPFINNTHVPILACNLDISKVPILHLPNLKKSVVFKYDKLKIGVIGYVTPDTKLISNPGEVVFLPEIESIQKELDSLKKNGVNIFIAVGHSGIQKDMEIARKVRGIDLVVGGHSNTFLYNGEQPSTEEIKGPYPTIITQEGGKKIPVVQAYAYTKYLGVLDIDFKDDGTMINSKGNSVLLNSSIPEDESVTEALMPWKLQVDEEANKKLGVTKVLLDGSDSVRRKESNLANFIADAFVDFYVKRYEGDGWTDAPIGMVQGGGIRSSINVASSGGVVTYVDILTVLPFEDNLCSIGLKGKHLLDALEWSIRYYDIDGSNIDGAFLQVSGLKIEFDLSLPRGSRVTKVLVRCGNCSIPSYTELDSEREYRILLSHYLSEGGDGFQMFKKDRTSYKNFDHFSLTGDISPAIIKITKYN